jgi:hypothetical protein
MERNLFLYWVGKEYKLILLFRKLIYLHSKINKGYNIHLITDKNIENYIKVIPYSFKDLCPAHQADFIRVNVICDYGGIWLDSDTLVIDSLDTLFDIIENKNGFFIKENNSILCNGVFGSKKNTELMLKWKEIIYNKINTTTKFNWTEIGNTILHNLYKTHNNLYDNYTILNGLDNVYPIYWKNCVTEFIKKPYDNYKLLIRNYQPLIILVNSVYKELEKNTTQEILHGNMPINYFINKSLSNLNLDINVLNDI